MTKTDFECIATHINQAMVDGTDVIDSICLAFKRINSSFDKAKFLTECCEGVSKPVPTVKVGDKIRIANDKWSNGAWYSIGDEGVVRAVNDESEEGGYSVTIELESGTWFSRDYELEVIG